MTALAAGRYDTYKASDTEWLGEVPGAWSVVRAKDLFAERNERSLTGDETLLTVSHITGVTPRSEKNVNMFMAETMEGYKVCHAGDLVINTMWAWMGALGTSPYDGICSPSYGVYAPRKGVPYCARYYDYVFRTPRAVVEMTRFSKGIVSSRLRLYSDRFFQIGLPLPDLATQQAIADYLDAKTAQIDRKIDLLTQKAAEYRQLKRSLINEAVTRGLDKSAPMKDSGIGWAGPVPSHWDVRRIKDLAFLKSGDSITADEIEDSGPYPVFGGNGLRGYCTSYTNDGEYVLIGRQGALCGNINFAQGKFWASEHAVVAYLKGAVHTKWFGEMLRVMNLNQYSVSAAQPGLSMERIKQLLLPVPSYCEQEAIAEHINSLDAQIEHVLHAISAQIGRLQELRKALIDDVVTGKLRVA